MEGLRNFLIPSHYSKRCPITNSFLSEFCDYICSSKSLLEEIEYWIDLNRLLCLLDCCQRFVNIISKLHYSTDIDPILETCSRLLDFCILSLEFTAKLPKSLPHEILKSLICSFFRGLCEVSPFLTPYSSHIVQAAVDNEMLTEDSSTNSQFTGSKSTLPIYPSSDCGIFLDPSISSNKGEHFRKVLFKLSSEHVISSVETNHQTTDGIIKGSVIFFNLKYFQFRADSSFFLLSILSSFLCTCSNSSTRNSSPKDNFLNGEILFYELLSLVHLTSIREAFDTSPEFLRLFSNACYSTLSAVLSSDILCSTVQLSQNSDSTQLPQFSYLQVIKYSLDVCDNFASFLDCSKLPIHVERNFRLFQTNVILRKVNEILCPYNIEAISSLATHFELTPQTVEIGYWISSSVRKIISDVSHDKSLSHDLFLKDDADIFAFSTPRSRFNYLIDQIPLISILFSFLINSYTKSFSSSVFSFIFEFHQTMKSEKHISPNLHDDFIKESLQTSLIFLLTSNIPIIDGFVNYQEILFHEIRSIVKYLPMYANIRTHEYFSLPLLPVISNHCLRYFSKLFEISHNLSDLIPLPPPNIPTIEKFSSNVQSFVDFSIFDSIFSSDYYHGVCYSDLPSYFMKFCCDILCVLREIFMESHCTILHKFLKQEVNHSHISALCFLVLEVQNFPFEGKFNLSKDFPNFTIDLLSTFHCFLFSGSFDDTFQMYFLEKIGFNFEKWPLFLTETMLFVLSRTIIYHMKSHVTSRDHFSIRFLTAFIDSLERKFFVVSEVIDFTDDVNFLHFELFLFTFSSIPLEYRISFLFRVIQLILSFSQMKIHNISSLLASSRLIILLEYFLFFLTTPHPSLYGFINSCFVNNWNLSQPENIPTSSLDQPFKLYISKYCKEFIQPFPDSVPILYEIMDRTNLKVDVNGLSTISNFHSKYSFQYSEFYSKLLYLTFNIEALTLSISPNKLYYFPHLFNYRYKSLKNILFYLPCPKYKPSSVQTVSTVLDIYQILTLYLPSKSVSMKESLCEKALNLLSSEFISKEEMLSPNFIRPIDVIHLAENFFSTITTSNTLSPFQLLLVSTSIIFKLFQTLNSLKELVSDDIPESTSFSLTEIDTRIVDQTVADNIDSQRFGNVSNISTSDQSLQARSSTEPLAGEVCQIAFNHTSSDIDLNSGDIANIEKPKEQEASIFISTGICSSLAQFILSDTSSRIIPLFLKFLNFLSDLCTRYLIIDSHANFDIIYYLLCMCTVESCSKDLTHYPPSCNIHLFEKSLDESSMRIFNSYQQISLSCFDEISLLGPNFCEKKHALSDILYQYLVSLSVDPFNSLAPVFKHCISTTSSFIHCLIKWCGDADILSNYVPEISTLIHQAPILSLTPRCTIDNFISKKFFKLFSDASTSLLLQKSFELITLPDLRYFCNANFVLHTYYIIILHSIKDVSINRIICSILENDPNFNFFSPLFLPIYPEFRHCLTSSIHTFADLLIYQKENPINESSIMISHLHSESFLNQERIYTYFDYAMLGYAGEEEKSIEERCDKLLVLANAISTGGTILPTSTCQFMLISILPLGHKLLDFINQLLSKSRKGMCIHSEKTDISISETKPYSFPLLSLSHPCLNSFLPIITGLAEVHNVHGELLILKAVSSWLPRCKDIVLAYISSQPNFIYNDFMLEFGASCSFLSDLLEQIKLITTVVKILMNRDGFDGFPDSSFSFTDDYENGVDITHSEDEEIEFSTYVPNDLQLNSQLCTISTTNKEEFKQHSYHCHTCKMTKTHGICTTCAKVCHKGHDLSYSRYSSVICSCGSRGIQSCKCLTTRIGNITRCDVNSDLTIDEFGFNSSNNKEDGLERGAFSDKGKILEIDPELIRLVEAIENEHGLKEELYNSLDFIDISRHTLDILSALVDVNTKCASLFPSIFMLSPMAPLLQQLHTSTKKFEYGEPSTVSNLRSPEGSFENIKFTFNEDSSSNTESLLASFSVIRNSLCSINGSGIMDLEYLLVSMDKGRFSTINRSAIFKTETNNSKKKIAISKISSMIAPFTIISMCYNPLCENYIAFCGIRDCCVYVINQVGQINDKVLPVQVGIQGSNYIVRAYWLPLSRTTLGIVTSEFIKLFDLSTDSFSPQYYFCLKSDYIVDSTYISTFSTVILYIITHSGSVYFQKVAPECVAEIGPVYLSSIIHVDLDDAVIGQSELKYSYQFFEQILSYFSTSYPDLCCQLNDSLFDDNQLILLIQENELIQPTAGVSIYFSHSLQLLFLSYNGGINFVASLNYDFSALKHTMPIVFKGSAMPITLCEWTESYLQPGFICALSRTTFSPVLLFLQANMISIVEMKTDPAKSKVVGIALDVKVKNSSFGGRTSLILLIDDGSLRVHNIKVDKIQSWQSYDLSVSSPLVHFRSKWRTKEDLSRSRLPTFPVDFFESCSLCDDIDFGGLDVLHVYNQAQVRNRLSSEFHYLFNCKPSGFKIEVINTNTTIVFMGIRIQLGSNSILQAPSFVEVFQRKIPIDFPNGTARWFDIPFSREESILSIRNFHINFGPSKDSNFYNYVDSILVYTKTKEEFGWVDIPDTEKLIVKTQLAQQSSQFEESSDAQVEVNKHETEFERLTHLGLTLLYESASIPSESRMHALDVVTKLLIFFLDKPMRDQCNMLLYYLHLNTQTFYEHKDEAICSFVVGMLYLTPISNFSPDFYQHLILNLHTIAVTRPYNITMLMDGIYLRKCCEKFSSPAIPLLIDHSTVTFNLPGFIDKIISIFWALYNCRPCSPYFAAVGSSRLTYIRETIAIITGIIYSFMVNEILFIPDAVEHIFDFLKSDCDCIWDSCLSTLCLLLRPKYRESGTMSIGNNEHRLENQSLSNNISEDSPTKKHKDLGTSDGFSNLSSDGSSNVTSEDVYQAHHIVVADPSIQSAEFSKSIYNLPDNKHRTNEEGKEFESLLNDQQIIAQMGMDPNKSVDDEAIINLALEISLQDQKDSSVCSSSKWKNLDPEISLDPPNLSSAHLDVDTLPDSHSRPSSSIDVPLDEHEQSGDQSSTGTLTPPINLAGTIQIQKSKRKSKSIDHFGELSSDQAGDSSPDDAESCDTHNSFHFSQSFSKDSTKVSSGTIKSNLRSRKNLGQPKNTSFYTSVLFEMLPHFTHLKDLGGLKAIHYMQLILTLMSGLNFLDTPERPIFSTITACVRFLRMNREDTRGLINRSNENEVTLIIFRFLSILLIREKKLENASLSESINTNSAWYITASILSNDSSFVFFSLELLKSLINYLKTGEPDDTLKSPILLTASSPTTTSSDLLPFFVNHYVSEKFDIFHAYEKVLVETIMRLACQLKRICGSYRNLKDLEFSNDWLNSLCEYMFITSQSQGAGRRNVRKLLLYLAGSRENYRKLRDINIFQSNMNMMFRLTNCGNIISSSKCYINTIDYDSQISILQCISICLECGMNRPENWQYYCTQNNITIPYLLLLSTRSHEEIVGSILHLVCCALCGFDFVVEKPFVANPVSTVESKSIFPDYLGIGKRILPNEQLIEQFLHISESIFGKENNISLRGLVSFFLLDANFLTLRVLSQAFFWAVFSTSSHLHKSLLLELFWSMSDFMLTFGQKAAQFVELLSHCTLVTPPEEIQKHGCINLAVDLLKSLNEKIFSHPNSNVYQILSTIVELDGYFLESQPCLICNNPEVPNTNMKMMTIRSDSKFTANSTIVKFISTYTITNIHLKISDLKRQKMVKTLKIYYSNKIFHSAVELKNKRDLWRKAKDVTLHAGQHELKIHFILPIVASNLIIEYSDLYENGQTTPETLQCPRCSAPVPVHPGICANCSENVFQCHKCRAINYDEKDPFLCNSCGFSKYGKFDYMLCAKACSSFEPINDEDERKYTIISIANLLEKADQVYKQLLLHRQALDVLLTDGTSDLAQIGMKSKVESVAIGFNKNIYAITQKYCNDCKATFNELSTIIQGVLAGREELLSFDLRHNSVPPRFAPISYPRKHSTNTSDNSSISSENSQFFCGFGTCYGCTALATKHCISILKDLAKIHSHKVCLIDLELLKELCNTNLRIGTSSMQNDVRDLILSLNQDNCGAAEHLMDWLRYRISYLIIQHHSHPNFGLAVHHEILLLKSAMEYDDSFWEKRLRKMFLIFQKSLNHSAPVILEYITLPCLKIFLHLIDMPTITSSKYSSMLSSDIHQPSIKENTIFIVLAEWLNGRNTMSFELWRNCETDFQVVTLSKDAWLKRILFHSSSQQARNTASSLLSTMIKDRMRQKLFIDLLLFYLMEVPHLGECAHEYLELILLIFTDEHWRSYLSSQGSFLLLGNLMSSEVLKISSLEDSTINVDVSLGYTLKMVSTLLHQLMCPKSLVNDVEASKKDDTSEFNNPPSICKPLKGNLSFGPSESCCDAIFLHHKSKLLPIVFDVYLSLKRLVIQRTKRIDDAQEKTFELLELLTSGTLEERREFIIICIDKLSDLPSTDLVSPVVIFEGLCSIISPEESANFDFFLSLEKDPQQEEFLQGRMQNNPYNSVDSTIGPLMRDVKNKVCRDTELLALLHEDTGMELLVCNKIISLDLFVKEVFQKIWLPDSASSGNVMKIIYRMRGLLGEATEDMIDSFAKAKEEIDDEQKYKAAGIMSECGGIDAIIYRLKCLQNPLLAVNLLATSLKLLTLCVKLQANRRFMLKNSLYTIGILLSIFTTSITILESSPKFIDVKPLENMLEIILAILHEASSSSFLRIDSKKSTEEKVEGDIDQLKLLLSSIGNSFVQQNTDILKRIMKLIPYLTYGDIMSMQVILDHFSRFLKFEEFDEHPSSEHSLFLDCFCNITEEISRDDTGLILKDILLESGIVIAAVDYLKEYTPTLVFAQHNVDWESFLNKPSLTYILRFLGGVCIDHSNCQKLIANIVPQLHLTEKATTSKGIGSLAENLLNNLTSEDFICDEVIKARKDTLSERIYMAQAFKEKSLAELGISIANGRMEMKYTSEGLSVLDESGLTCCICMEGYENHPRKILGIYTFSKACIMEEFENKSRKTQGYSSVSGFSIVHLDCHNTAIRTSRQSRGKEEWESASIHNSNIRCNSIMPLWGPEVQDNGYFSCLAKYHSSIQDATGFREPNFWSSIHDLKILLKRYSFGKSFSEDCGGGSRLSNLQFICYFISYSFHLLQSSNSIAKESLHISDFIALPCTDWITSSYNIDSPTYYLIVSVFILTKEQWRINRLVFLERIIITAHSRYHSSTPISVFPFQDVLEYNVYKPYLIVFALVDRINLILKLRDFSNTENMVSNIIQEYKNNDRAILSQFELIMGFLDEDILPSETFAEFCDVLDILDDIPKPDLFMSNIFCRLPKVSKDY